jgi:DUF917 family protein
MRDGRYQGEYLRCRCKFPLDSADICSCLQSAESSQRLEKMMRVTCIELGLSTSAVAAPLRGFAIKKFAIPNTVSQAWFLGRAVHIARQTKTSIVGSIVSRKLSAVPKLILHSSILYLESCSF